MRSTLTSPEFCHLVLKGEYTNIMKTFWQKKFFSLITSHTVLYTINCIQKPPKKSNFGFLQQVVFKCRYY